MGWLLLSLRRLRDARVAGAALAMAVLATAFVFAAAPRLLEAGATAALRDEVNRAPPGTRNLQVLQDGRFGLAESEGPLAVPAKRGTALEAELPPGLAALISERSMVLDTPRWIVQSRLVPETTVTLRIHSGAAERVRLVGGRFPTGASRAVDAAGVTGDAAGAITALEVALSTATATQLSVALGDTLVLGLDPSDRVAAGHADRLAVDIVGIFEVAEPAASYWFDDPAIERPLIRTPAPLVQIADATLLLAGDAYPPLYRATLRSELPLRHAWRFELDASRFDAPSLPALLADLRRLETIFARSAVQGFNVDPVLESGLIRILEGQHRRWQSAETVLTVVALGPAVVAFAALALIALLASARRRPALALARGRGASVRQLVASVGAEGLLLAGPAAAIGAVGAVLVLPSGPTALSLALAAAGGLAAIVFLVIAIVPAALRAERPAGATIASSAGPSPRRLVFEGLLVGIALVGVALLRDRGVRGATTAGELATADPLIAAVPALAGFATAVIAMRLFPFPMRLVAEIAGTGRGFVMALGVRRAMRGGGSPIVLVVLLAAAALATFSSAMLAHVGRGSETIGWQAVGAAHLVTSTTGSLPAGLNAATLPGVEAAAGGWTGPGTITGKSTRVTLLGLDAASFDAVTAGTPAALPLPAALVAQDTRARTAPGSGGSDGAEPLEAAVSTDVTRPDGGAYAVGDAIEVRMGTARIDLRVGGFLDRAPLVAGDQFVIVSRTALEGALAGRDLRPTGLLLRAPDAAATDLRAALARVSPALVLTSRLERTTAILVAPALAALGRGIAIAGLVAAAYAALAVIVALALTGAARATEVGQLRTLGITHRQALGLLAVEQGPAVVVAFAGGIALGLVLFVLLRPGLGLEGLLGAAVDVPLGVEPVHLAALLAVMAAVVAVGIALGARFQGAAPATLALRRGME